MKKVAILYSEYSPTIDAIIYKLNNFASVELFATIKDVDLNAFDLIVCCGFEEKLNVKTLNIHHSLLPAFNTNTPIKDAVLEGAKVTGLTIFYTNPYQIIAQYPIFIRNNAHYDEIKQELLYLEQTIYPLVIEKILKNEPFEIRELLSQKDECKGNCKECGGCKN